ncbi:SMP-30/gluconolactonase/LRE family protein [Sphingopyxis macrogoltabida]|uniref:Gluconolaconase n=1 Tax=Sphingopyxis macrogoltabida TaxID=33050 RepID=A0AAC9AZ12_SPHMC|nr:SMP-30/gluconolactonase/LRE family protein [Sphingopyxis macrogoltabida]ALJ16359.1 gluconolaconase [Sphingopyxis macrogoltabida]AMU92594.1 gluconolaconase [Sphingopyxis macrogoltabida]
MEIHIIHFKETLLELEIVADGLAFPEGPIAMADGSILLVEIKGARLTRIASDGTKTVVAETGGGPNGAAIGPDGAVYIANNGGLGFIDHKGLTFPSPGLPPQYVGGSIQRVGMASGVVTTLYDHCDGAPLIAPNDLVFDRDGGFWFTDHGCETDDGRRFGALYYARFDGTHITCRRSKLIAPNGVGLSPDETTLYVADTLMGRLWALDVNGPGNLKSAGTAYPRRPLFTMPDHRGFDSLAVERDGRVCVGTLIEGGISVIGLDGSLEWIPIPDIGTTNICFGGADMRDVWITGSTTGRLFKARWPRPGLILNFAC